MGPGNIRHTDQMLIHIVGQGFGDAEPCFFVQGNSRNIAAGYVKQKAADLGFLKAVYKPAHQQKAKTPAAQIRQNLYMMNAECVL